MATINEKEDRIKVIVIGAGLGGCAAALAMKHHGHDVVIYEKLNTFRRLGDSLGLGENALKLLQRWGGDWLYDSLTSIGNQASDMQIRRWRDGKLLAQQPLMDMAGYIGHRGDYHEVFLHGVKDAGIEINMGCEVIGFGEGDDEDERPSITFRNNRVEKADVIVGADGIKSRARELVLGFADAPKSSGYSCWRAYFPGEDLKEDALCRDFVDHDCVNIWIGEDTHLVQNTLRNGEEFNWIITRKLSHEADMEIRESWFQEGDMADVRKHIVNLDPSIAAAVEKTPSLLDWKICYRDPLQTWVSKNHKIVLLGDSCHPHLPTSAQGASQATESAAVLAVCLKLAGKNRLSLATRVYEKIRFGRTRQSQTAGEDLRDRWHNALKHLEEGAEIDPESVKMRNRWLYAYDAEADTLEKWEKVSSRVAEELIAGKITPLCDAIPKKASTE
ncbi:6-hydroxynicotinate 3-monooxygenase [Cytospora mali]|uniref:6-hydroxynicotinate 3-monooxygenase n=1 Tax=Cytospora mali TaxID=578113 RepID=A0A194UXH8_CYTMA|nr:6-hydroxynicotinate 3-monooxygenase [Valsa mali var. pyri (nom. inval.)]